MTSLFQQIPASLPEELCETLCHSEHVLVERIVSRGHVSPDDFWDDQAWHEFVLLTSSRARLVYADGTPTAELSPGDWLVIPARVRHRVDWTDPGQDTIWLAVHDR